MKGKLYFYGYFNDESSLEAAITKSLQKDMEGVWVIPPKRKKFSNIISTRISQNTSEKTVEAAQSELVSAYRFVVFEKMNKVLENMREGVRHMTDRHDTESRDKGPIDVSVNKSRQTDSLFNEIQKQEPSIKSSSNAKKQDLSSSLPVPSDEVVNEVVT